MPVPFSVVILFLVFVFIMVRKVGNIQFRIWQIMTFGVLLNIATFQITFKEALRAIDFEILLFLAGMFVVGEALYRSNYLESIAYHVFRKATSTGKLILYIIFVMGFLSAILMNDTVAVIGTVILIRYAEKYGLPVKPLLLSLAFAITIGSVMSPIGNPQNLLIAESKFISHPFITFFQYLFLPTVINLLYLYAVLWLFFRKSFGEVSISYERPEIRDPRLARLSAVALGFILFMIAVKVAFFFFRIPWDFPLYFIALGGGFVILVFSKERFQILRAIDWETIIFFASMFVVIRSAWNTQFFQSYLHELDFRNLTVIFVISILLSQILSNVPLVMLFLGILELAPGEVAFAGLAAASTIAGNLTVLGAASNVIIIQNAEKHGIYISSWEFSKIGIVITLGNALLYYFFLRLWSLF